MSSYRRSGYDYAYDDYRGGERWDRDRFERMRGGNRDSRGSGTFRYEEDDRYYDRGGPRGSRGSRTEVFEESRTRDYDDRYYDDERYSTPRRSRPAYLDDDRYQVSNREIAPYRPRYERDNEGGDSYDRRPAPRYDQERENINVNLNLRSPPPPPPAQPNYNPRREYYEEDEYEDIRIRRERERSVYRRYDDLDDRNDSQEAPQSPSFKRGRTRMPKRLVHRSAIIQKGYPFEEETDFYIVRIALRKDEIDEIIKISESYFHEEKLSVTISEKKSLPAPEPAPEPAAEENEVVETVTTKVIENPTEEDLEKYGKADSSSSSNHAEEQQSSHHRSKSHSKSQSETRSTHVSKTTTKVDQKSSLSPTSAHHSHGDRSGNRGRSHSRTKNMELVAERSSSSSDREVATTTLPDRSKDDEVEIVRVEKDSGGRGQFVASRPGKESRSRSRRRPNQKMVDAALFSLT